MARERLFIIHGTGPDAVGLVGKITSEIAAHKGNIVDLRQDVLHGLFILYAVVDLSESILRTEEFSGIIKQLGEDTGLTLQVEKYNPIARNPDKKNMLLILVGADKIGIIASISQLLGKYGINIEFARNIGREGVFLMELMTDISSCSLPIDNIKSTVSNLMSPMGIKALFQTEDVFNKKKRVILFDIAANLMDEKQRTEIINQVSLDAEDLKRLCSDKSFRLIAQRLEGMPFALYEAVINSVQATPDTVELLQTLKIMGYVICLIAPASTLFLENLSARIGIDYSFGVPYEVDDDSQTFTGSIESGFSGIDRRQCFERILSAERISQDDVTVINSWPACSLPGIHPVFDIGTVIDLYNKHGISKERLNGLIASFGAAGTA